MTAHYEIGLRSHVWPWNGDMRWLLINVNVISRVIPENFVADDEEEINRGATINHYSRDYIHPRASRAKIHRIQLESLPRNFVSRLRVYIYRKRVSVSRTAPRQRYTFDCVTSDSSCPQSHSSGISSPQVERDWFHVDQWRSVQSRFTRWI